MIAGGVGSMSCADDVHKGTVPAGALLVVLGGPAMLIGLGGGAASSMGSGTSSEDLDYASVQRGNPEMQRRAQEVIDGCWAAGLAGGENPLIIIHDVGAGGLSNAVPELVDHSHRGAGGRVARDSKCGARHVAARNLVQRGAGALCACDRTGEARMVRCALPA